MKKYVKPLMEGQIFTANEYVAACGDNGKVYKFECNAPAGSLYYYPSTDGTIDGKYTGSGTASLLGSYYPCRDKHQTSTSDVYYDGFVDYNRNGNHDEDEGVIVWIERGWFDFIKDAHATANLDMKSWEISKS